MEGRKSSPRGELSKLSNKNIDELKKLRYSQIYKRKKRTPLEG